MCFKTTYSYIACRCPADKPADKQLYWIKQCDYSRKNSPHSLCEDVEKSKPTPMHLRGLCPACMLLPDPKISEYQPAFETKEYQAYKLDCVKRRLENPEYYRWQHTRRNKPKASVLAESEA